MSACFGWHRIVKGSILNGFSLPCCTFALSVCQCVALSYKLGSQTHFCWLFTVYICSSIWTFFFCFSRCKMPWLLAVRFLFETLILLSGSDLYYDEKYHCCRQSFVLIWIMINLLLFSQWKIKFNLVIYTLRYCFHQAQI